MSIFGDILSKIFPSNHPAVAQAQTATPTATAPSTTPASTVGGAAAGASPASTGASSGPPVDVQKIPSDKAAQSGQQLNWQTSIVDLLKLLGLEQSDRAQAVGQRAVYSGDTNDSATMNVWLIKQMMSQLAANGGKVPANLMH